MKNTNLESFKFSYPISMRWNDSDALGHINNIYYFEYFQIGRGAYMPIISKDWDWNEHMFVIAHIECDYYKELKLTSKNVEIRMRVSSLSKKSFNIEYLIVSEHNDGSQIIHAKGMSVQVMIDMKAKSTILIPDWLRKDIVDYEPYL